MVPTLLVPASHQITQPESNREKTSGTFYKLTVLFRSVETDRQKKAEGCPD